MQRKNRKASPLGGFSSGANLGGKLSHYRNKQNIYRQGSPAYTLFYIQEGGVRLTTRTKHQPAAVTAILGAHDFFGELCLAGYPLRMSTAVALTASSIRTIKKAKMLQMLRRKNKTSNSLVAYLLSSVKNYQDHVAHLLTSSAEQRLARVLLRLAHLDRKGPAVVEIPVLSHQVLAEMVGTTRPRVNLFMNRFRKKGHIDYDGGLEDAGADSKDTSESIARDAGGDDWHDAVPSQFLHEQIQETGFYPVRRRDSRQRFPPECGAARLSQSAHLVHGTLFNG
ncbi:MAG: Crp/Fnr family transcriptional regulator [Candidatus Acidiferrum sp.]